jgi:valyl-tRNA synthetase
MELTKTYNPSEVEQHWYQYWLDNGYFASKPNPDKEPYCVVIPPPNVTGVLHMGHMLNNTIQDVMVRRARMLGKEACWVPGTDHASIATEAKVVQMLRAEGIHKKDLSREAFLERAWEWKEKYGGIILKQLRHLGCSADWDRTRFTMEPKLSAAVIDTFVDLYNKGLMYRGLRMVNWDPIGKTALSDEEVFHKEVNSKLYYVKYYYADAAGKPTAEFLTVATTRPETILADVAIAVNPEDERYLALLGKHVIVPFTDRLIPIIGDNYVDAAFGTGCLKVTPAHDINDYEIGLRHNLPIIEGLNDDGTLSEAVGIPKYIGLDRFEARKLMGQDLEEAGHILKVEEIKNNLGYSERTNAVIEPRLSLQWFLKMKELAGPALDAVMNDTIKLHPARFKNTYRVWMENVRDWCVSRQLWWGQRIPAYYLPDGQIVVANSDEKALALAQALVSGITADQLKQDEDVMDTWFSSWLWPISVFDGFENPDNEDINYYYPTADLVTAPEILFFWVARMVMAGYEYRGLPPFRNVYLTGIVRDKQGRKMSKSLGNSPDPLDLIAQYGADAVRVGMLLCSPAGNDLPYDEKLVEQGRNFCNKIWNAYRLIQGWQVDETLAQPADNQVAIAWFGSRISQAITEVNDLYDKFRMSEALMTTYKLVWDDFCAWYLELIKPAYQAPIDAQTLAATHQFLEQVLALLHPFTPFITEELWQNLNNRNTEQALIISAWPQAQTVDTDLLAAADHAFEVINQIRNVRSNKGLSPREPLALLVKTADTSAYQQFGGLISKLGNLNELGINAESAEAIQGVQFVVKGDECLIPMEGLIDVEAEREALTKELNYTIGFRDSVKAKLSNEKFVANAKADVVERERQKLADAEAKINALEQSLVSLA